jgi:hypothetical protein
MVDGDVIRCLKCGSIVETVNESGACGACSGKTRKKKGPIDLDVLRRPHFRTCRYCRKSKIYPIDFTDETTCILCSRKDDPEYFANPKVLKRNREWRAKNVEKVSIMNQNRREKLKQWRREHPEEARKKYIEATKKRRARLKALELMKNKKGE